MKICIVTDAWMPQVNGVVTTLVELVRELRAAGHQVQVVEPGQFRTRHAPSSGVMVPTPSVLEMLQRRGFRNLRAWTHGVDTDLFQLRTVPGSFAGLEDARRPIALFVGRVSYEKNIAAFLRMPFPGTKVVCGVGPVEAQLRQQHPEVRWVGLLPRPELAKLYGAADLFVFPSHADTFGLVMVEAMACGTPVAAYPVDGPLTVLGRPRPDGSGSLGGAMHEDLQKACFAALGVPRFEARERALDFSWQQAARLFAGFLVPTRAAPAAGAAGKLSRACHEPARH